MHQWVLEERETQTHIWAVNPSMLTCDRTQLGRISPAVGVGVVSGMRDFFLSFWLQHLSATKVKITRLWSSQYFILSVGNHFHSFFLWIHFRSLSVSFFMLFVRPIQWHWVLDSRRPFKRRRGSRSGYNELSNSTVFNYSPCSLL